MDDLKFRCYCWNFKKCQSI